MGMTYRNPFLEYDPEDPYKEYEQEEDLSALTPTTSRGQSGHDPGLWLEPKQTHMLDRKGSGGFSLGPNPAATQGEIKTVQPAGIEAKDNTVSKLIEARRDAAGWGTEDADSDRMLPQDIDTSNKGTMDSSAKPAEKPPGPDSPSNDYKKTSKFIGNPDLEKEQKAYDEEFGSGKKHHWWSLESTEQWNRRREDTARDLDRKWRSEVTAAEMERRETPRAIGHQALNGPDGKKRLYAIFTDGTSKVVAEGLDESAKRRYLSDSVTWDKKTGYGYKQLQSGEWERQEVPSYGAPAEIGPQAGMPGPTLPDYKAPLHGGDAVRARYFNVPANTDVYKDEGGTVSKVASGQPRAASPGRTSTKDPEVALDDLARKTVETRLKNDEKYQRMHPRAKEAFFEAEVASEKKRRKASRGKGGGTPAAAAPSGDEDLTVMKYD